MSLVPEHAQAVWLSGTRILTSQDRRVLDLYDVKVTVDGLETPAIADVADQLRGMIAEAVPEPMSLVVGLRGNRRQRRAQAARRRKA